MERRDRTPEQIPFNRPFTPEASFRYVQESLGSGFLAGNGPFGHRAESMLEALTGSPCQLTPSCTHALELACRLLELGPGDEVILPSFNFPSAATAVALTGATPIFVDVDPWTKNITANAVRDAMTDQTRAVIVLHYAGNSAPVESIRLLMEAIGGHVIEDAAHGLGTHSPRGQLGSFGTFAAYSFHETKNINCGEGGALQINDPQFIERAEVLREKGTNRQRFFRGEVDKYSWLGHGSSWLLADPLAALLVGQLERFEQVQTSRADVFRQYSTALRGWAAENSFTVSEAVPQHENAAHMFYLVAPDLEVRSRFIQFMKSRGVSVAFHYQPLDTSLAGRQFGRSSGCPVSKQLGDRLVRLPLYENLSESEIAFVISTAREFTTYST